MYEAALIGCTMFGLPEGIGDASCGVSNGPGFLLVKCACQNTVVIPGHLILSLGRRSTSPFPLSTPTWMLRTLIGLTQS